MNDYEDLLMKATHTYIPKVSIIKLICEKHVKFKRHVQIQSPWQAFSPLPVICIMRRNKCVY